MSPDEPSFGPLQPVVIGFESIERVDGELARELRDLRRRGPISIVDARLLSRSEDGELTEIDLDELIGEPVGSEWRPAAHLFGFNGKGPIGDAGVHEHDDRMLAVPDLVREAPQVLDGEAAGLTPEVMMIVGAELQAKADAEAAIELADAARGAASLRALETLTGEEPRPAPSPRAAAAATVVGALVNAGFVRECEAAEAIDALAERGIVEQALLHGAAAEAEELLAKLGDEPPTSGE